LQIVTILYVKCNSHIFRKNRVRSSVPHRICSHGIIYLILLNLNWMLQQQSCQTVSASIILCTIPQCI